MPYDTRASRDVPIVDFAAHTVVTENVPEEMESIDAVIGATHTDPDLLAKQYEEAGIDQVVLSQPPYMGIGNADTVARANNELIDIVQDTQQFYGLAAIPTAAGGESAATEFERCLDSGYNGGTLATRSDGIELTDRAVEPIFEVAEAYDAPLLVHPKLDDSLHREVLDDTYRLNAIFGREAALSESICNVIHQDILESFSELNLVFHHLGGNIGSMLGRVHLHLDMGRWPGQEHIKPFEQFKHELETRIYVDSSGFWGYHAPLRATLEEFPASQVLFGTDAPYEPRSADELARHATAVMDVTADTDSERVLGGNALDLLVNVNG